MCRIGSEDVVCSCHDVNNNNKALWRSWLEMLYCDHSSAVRSPDLTPEDIDSKGESPASPRLTFLARGTWNYFWQILFVTDVLVQREREAATMVWSPSCPLTSRVTLASTSVCQTRCKKQKTKKRHCNIRSLSWGNTHTHGRCDRLDLTFIFLQTTLICSFGALFKRPLSSTADIRIRTTVKNTFNFITFMY